jgi:hypothetical protein
MAASLIVIDDLIVVKLKAESKYIKQNRYGAHNNRCCQ